MSDPSHTRRLTTARSGVPQCGLALDQILANRYRLDAHLGWGGLAVVFEATDLRNQHRLAVKVVRTDLAPAAHQEAVAILRWEAQLLRRLKHPALPRLARFYSDSASTWLARDLVSGLSLAEYAARGPCSPHLVHSWALQICDLLRYLHTQSPPVICGDIKPANLVLRPNGALTCIDLGAAQTLTRRPPRRPRPRYGTPGYAPPEQLGNWGHDERSDLFSMAVVCYELLLGIDPTAEPLQFDFQQLDTVAPMFAPVLRWALTLDPARRVPTAAVLRSALAPPALSEPLYLGYGVSIVTQRDLLGVAVRHPQLIENALTAGSIERWLAQHPERDLGMLLHNLRAAQRAAASRQRPLDVFLSALAPSEGGAMLRMIPDYLVFGSIPLRHWRVWSRPLVLTLHNQDVRPLRWELECPNQASAEVRLVRDGRMVRQREGVLPPGGRAKIELVAAGKSGRQHGHVILRCGTHTTHIPWEGTAMAGLSVGSQFVAHLDELDLTRLDLIPALEELLHRGVLVRWLRAQGHRALATELAAALKHAPLDELTARLLVGRVLYHTNPVQFPWLQLHGVEQQPLSIVAGKLVQQTLEVENRGTHPCVVAWRSRCTWARVDGAASIIPPGGRQVVLLTLAPPASLAAGLQAAALEIQTGSLTIPVTLPVQIVAERWWQRAWRWLAGN
jgi:hypothetical protein